MRDIISFRKITLIHVADSRVHFGDFEDVDTSLLPTSENKPLLAETVEEELQKTLRAYFGLLQEAHRYQVKFGIPMEEIKTYVMGRDDKLEVKTQPGSCRLLGMSWTDDENVPGGLMLQLVMEIEIRSGISFEDEFTIRSGALPNRSIHVRIAAQVLGKSNHLGVEIFKCTISETARLSASCPNEAVRYFLVSIFNAVEQLFVVFWKWKVVCMWKTICLFDLVGGNPIL